MPFEIPESWEWVKLDELASYKKGPFGSSLTKAMFVPESLDTFKVYEQKNAIQKDVTLGNYFISKEHFDKLKGFEVQPNDIIVSCAGTIGETYVMPLEMKKGIINQALMYVRLHLASITPFYLIYFDTIIKSESNSDSKGTAIKNIPPFEVLKNYFFPLPPLAEQQRIVAEVEKWFALIDELEVNKEDLKEYIKQVKSKVLDLAIHGKLVPQDPNDEPAIELLKRINPSFKPCDTSHYENLPNGWTVCSIKDISKTISSRQYQVLQSDICKEGTFPVVSQSANYIEGYFNLKDKVLEHKQPVIVFGDHTRVVKYIDFDFIVGADGVKILSPMIDSKYFYYLILNASENIKNRGYGRHFGLLSKEEYFIPPLKEQHRIVSLLETIEKQLDTISAEL